MANHNVISMASFYNPNGPAASAHCHRFTTPTTTSSTPSLNRWNAPEANIYNNTIGNGSLLTQPRSVWNYEQYQTAMSAATAAAAAAAAAANGNMSYNEQRSNAMPVYGNHANERHQLHQQQMQNSYHQQSAQQQHHSHHQTSGQQQTKQLSQPLAGKSGTSNGTKDICGSADDKFKEDGDPWNVEAQAAFLGPNLWDKTLPYDTDLKVAHYADLDEFLSENNIPDGLPGSHLAHSTGLGGHRSDSLGHSAGLLGLGHITTKRERSPSPSDCVSPDTINPPSPAESTFSFASSGRDFDPRTRAFSDEELKPQPMIKKSRKQFVPDELKDDKYWARRRKNNIAAKRSRDARRQKENQIAMRARYLEKENSTLHQELEQLKQENMELRARLSKYQDV